MPDILVCNGVGHPQSFSGSEPAIESVADRMDSTASRFCLRVQLQGHSIVIVQVGPILNRLVVAMGCLCRMCSDSRLVPVFLRSEMPLIA